MGPQLESPLHWLSLLDTGCPPASSVTQHRLTWCLPQRLPPLLLAVTCLSLGVL